jgi:hypothetical protein
MKKFIFLIIAMLLMAMAQQKADACPDGYSPGTKTFDYLGCNVTVLFCYKIVPGNEVVLVEVEDVLISHYCDHDIAVSSYFWMEVNQSILESLVPPCPEPGEHSFITVYEIKRKACRYYHNNPELQILELKSCNTIAECIGQFNACWDGDQLVYVSDPLFVFSPDNQCPTVFPEIPPPGLGMWNEWETPCFMTPCEYDYDGEE